MQIQRLNRTDPERIFMTFKNSYSTASLTAGQWAAVDMVTDQDGISVTKPAGFNRMQIAGVSNGTIAHGSYGLLQVWGYRADARCLGGSGYETSKLSAGQPMHFLTSGFAAQAFAHNSASAKSVTGKRICGVCMVAANTAAIATQAGTSGEYKVMINCL